MSADNVKGPWSLNFEFDGWKNVRTICNSSGDEIMCDTPYYPWCPDTDDEWRLIATAPEMLQMLRHCHQWLQGSKPGRAQAIGELIRKATGEQDTGRESNG